MYIIVKSLCCTSETNIILYFNYITVFFKMWSIHKTEYHSTLKRKGMLTHAKIWVNLDDIMLSEISQ